MQHIINIAFDFDDQTVKEKLEANAERQILDELKRDINSYMFGEYGYTGEIDIIATNLLQDFINDHKEEIIDSAVKKLAEKLARTKAVREKVNEVLDL